MKFILITLILISASFGQAQLSRSGTVTTLDEVAQCAYDEMSETIRQFRTHVGIRTHNQFQAIRAGVYSKCIMVERKGVFQEPEKILASFNVGIDLALRDVATPQEKYNAAVGNLIFNFDTGAH